MIWDPLSPSKVFFLSLIAEKIMVELFCIVTKTL